MKERANVLVTGVGGGGHGHEIVKALKLAGGYHLIGVDMSESSFGLSDVDEAFTVPPANNPDYIPCLLELCASRRVRVIVHGSEPELRAISDSRERFLERGVLPLINSREIIELGMNKWATMEFLAKHNFKSPRSVLVAKRSDIASAFPLPAVVKPAVGGGGSSDTFIVQERDELDFVCDYLLRQGRSLLLQEYVGTPDDEYTVGVLHTLDGAFIGSIALRRYILSGLSNRIKVPNRSGKPELSPLLAISSGISQGTIEEFPELRRQCEALATALQSRGPINIQCRFVDGVLYPFEINPRFSGTTYLRALAGYNEPDMLIRYHLFGEKPPQPVRYRYGRIVRGLVERHTGDFPEIRAANCDGDRS